MSAPVLWILLPLVFASLLLIISNQKAIFLVACLLSLFLAMAAWLLPIDTVLTIGSWTFKLAPSVEILPESYPYLGQPVIPCLDLWLRLVLVYPGGFPADRQAYDSIRAGHNLPAGRGSGGATIPLCSLDN